LRKLGVKNAKFYGNLKFSESEKEIKETSYKLKKYFNSKIIWCASSTHQSEEIFCGKVHRELKKKFKNLLTIIIPRHVERINTIKSELVDLKLKIHIHSSRTKINNNVDIYLVDTYGKTKSFYSACQNVFLGGSLINHGGQNPLEAARFGCNILHGPNIFNFKEIYSFLKKNNLSKEIFNQKVIIKELTGFFSKKRNPKKIQKKINLIGQNILKNTLNEINLLLKNAN